MSGTATAIGEITEDGRAWVVHDGAAHPACWAALLAAATWERAGGPSDVDLDGGRALAVEQSNSSVLLPATAGGTMLKVLRAIAVGPNPDVTIPRALAAQGWTGVPRPLAWFEVTWDAVDDPPRRSDAAAPPEPAPPKPRARKARPSKAEEGEDGTTLPEATTAPGVVAQAASQSPDAALPPG